MKGKIKIQNLRHRDVPATAGLVNEVRQELLAETSSVRKDMKSMEKRLDGKISQVDGKISQMDGKISQLDGKICQLDGKISQLDGKINQLDGKISQLDGKITHLDGKISHLDSRVDGVESKIDQVLSTVHGMKVLMEEQRSENRVVLDAIKAVADRQDRSEEEAREFRETLRLLVRGKDATSTPK